MPPAVNNYIVLFELAGADCRVRDIASETATAVAWAFQFSLEIAWRLIGARLLEPRGGPRQHEFKVLTQGLTRWQRMPIGIESNQADCIERELVGLTRLKMVFTARFGC